MIIMRYSLYLSLIVAVSAVSFSCTDYQEPDVPERLSLDTSEISLSPESANCSVLVQSGTSWDVSGKPDWVDVKTITRLSQPYNWNVTFAVNQNDDFDRDGTISIRSDNGSAHIAVFQQGKKGKYVAVQGVQIPSSLTLTEGETKKLTPVITPSNASVQTVTWQSRAPTYAAVYADGTVTAVSPGWAAIVVTTDDGNMQAQCNVTVKAKVYSVTGVSLNESAISMAVGDTWALVATVTPENATNKSVSWSSSNTSVATVSSSGLVTAKAAGNATITVTTDDGNKTATCSVAVSVPVTGVSLDRTSLNMPEGGTQTLTATVSPSNATDKTVSWTSSNTSVATVSSSGVVTAHAAGNATITVMTHDGSKKANCYITVYIPVSSVSLDKSSLAMDVGETQDLTATVSPSNAADKSVTWSSSNTSVATVSTSGVVTAKAGGNATITVTTNDGGKTATCAVTVRVPVSSVTLNKTSLTISEGGSQTLTATVSPSNATNKSVSWASDNESVATVTSSGVVVAKAAGTAVITVTTVDGGKTASCVVTVKPRVTGVTLNYSSISLIVGSSRTLTATVTPSDALDKSVTWSSNNTSVATVSTSGTVSAKAVGTAVITVRTNDGGKTATCTVTVTPVSVTGVSLNKSSLTLYVSDNETLVATVSPTNATNKSVTWSSSNYSVANVNSAGTVSALSAGSAIITATTSDGGYTATCSVTVKADTHGAVDLGLSVKWSSYNYGATSVTATGGYYMWGDPTGNAIIGHSAPNMDAIGGTQYDIVRKNWGGSWRIPTRAEINELYSRCSFTSTTVNGVSVLRVTGPSGASIYLPYTGYASPTGRDGPYELDISNSGYAYMMSSESYYRDGYGRIAYVYYFTSSGQMNSVNAWSWMYSYPIRPVR